MVKITRIAFNSRDALGKLNLKHDMAFSLVYGLKLKLYYAAELQCKTADHTLFSIEFYFFAVQTKITFTFIQAALCTYFYSDL